MKSIHILSVVGILLCVVGLSFSQNCNQTLPREECCNTTGCGYFGCDQVTPPPGWEDGCFNMSMNPGNCSDVCNGGGSAIGQAAFTDGQNQFFNAVDTDNDGHISADEYQNFYSILGLDPGLAAAAFKAIDTNNDGKLSVEEFTEAGTEF